MKIAVVGCSHGELDVIYELIKSIQSRRLIKIDMLLINGDFQAVRNEKDMDSLATPAKYAQMKTFWKYYSGRSQAPVLTLLIGGNHECSNYMSELPYGGWIAPNIYYLGYANVLNFNGLRIAGISGIYHSSDYMRGHFESPPFDRNSMRSIYHVRNLEIFRLMQLRDGRPFDIIFSHDWPQGVYRCGDQATLLRKKPFLSNDVCTGRLGNPYTAELLQALKPRFWFSAHHHCKFAAKIQHGNNSNCHTHFLALDKCSPRREFLQILDIDPVNESLFGNRLCLDPEWLCVLRSTDHLLSTSPGNVYMPGPNRHERYDFKPTRQELQNLLEDFGGVFDVPSAENTFVQTAPIKLKCSKYAPYRAYQNPQTSLICQMLDIRDPVEVIYRQTNRRLEEPEELEDGEIFDDGEFFPSTNTTPVLASTPTVLVDNQVNLNMTCNPIRTSPEKSFNNSHRKEQSLPLSTGEHRRANNWNRRQRNSRNNPYYRINGQFNNRHDYQQLQRQQNSKVPDHNNFNSIHTKV